MKTIKKDYKNKLEINIEIYVIKKIIRREYGRIIYRNMSKEDKPKLEEYQKYIVT